jgi:hypothetical protein
VHVRGNHSLGIILTLHHCTLQTVLEVTNLILRDIPGCLVRDLALVGALLDLFFPPIFTSSFRLSYVLCQRVK